MVPPDVLRYGENPHQRAALYTGTGRPGLAEAEQLHGKAMSYNNYVDADAAWRAAFDFAQPCVAIIKHSNPCGIALGTDLAEAHRKANACDPQSAFGGVIAANGMVTAAMAAQVKDIFTEVVVAPGFEDEALDILRGSKNVRLLQCAPPPPEHGRRSGARSDGGLLLQTPDRIDAPGDDPANWELKTGQPAAPDTLADLAFAWRAMPQREVERDPAGGRRRVGRRRAWARSTGSTRAAWRWPGPGTGRSARSRPATRTSRSRTTWRC